MGAAPRTRTKGRTAAPPAPDEPGAWDRGPSRPVTDPDLFRDAMARWASSVVVFAVRDPEDGRVRATTATSFAPVSVEPAHVVVSLGANAQALPFVRVGGAVGLSLLGEDQRRWAQIFADTFPAGPSPWAAQGVPLIAGSVAKLSCIVRAIHPTEGGSRLIVAEVADVVLGDQDRPLLYWRRSYRTLAEE